MDLAQKLKCVECVAALDVLFGPGPDRPTQADPAVMAKVSPREANPADDPLFVAATDPHLVARENSVALRQNALTGWPGETGRRPFARTAGRA